VDQQIGSMHCHMAANGKCMESSKQWSIEWFLRALRSGDIHSIVGHLISNIFFSETMALDFGREEGDGLRSVQILRWQRICLFCASAIQMILNLGRNSNRERVRTTFDGLNLIDQIWVHVKIQKKRNYGCCFGCE
jgi:hypothetical protein